MAFGVALPQKSLLVKMNVDNRLKDFWMIKSEQFSLKGEIEKKYTVHL